MINKIISGCFDKMLSLPKYNVCFFALFLSVVFHNNLFANNKFTDRVYRNSIKTVILEKKGLESSMPLIELGSDDRLHLQFDDLDPVQRQLYYSIEHCNADWTPSGIMFSYYLRGLRQDIIQDFKYSFNTRKQYLHYDLEFPNQQMEILLSGNYILKVFEDGNEDNLILTRRFMVYRNQVKIAGKVRRPSLMELRNTHQEIDAIVNLEDYQAVNPQVNSKLVIIQNGITDNAIFLKPFGINHKQLNYDYDNGTNCFTAGNEFRFFDTRSLRQQSISVKRFIRDSALVEVILLQDPIRRFLEYQAIREVNGRFFIRNSDGNGEPPVDADYGWVNFSLPFEAPLKDGNLFLFGSFSDWQCKDEFRLHYDYATKAYTNRILLKQGIFNYCYVFQSAEDSKIEHDFIEGSYYTAENDYLILFYGRAYTNNFDELIGVCRLNSLENQ